MCRHVVRSFDGVPVTGGVFTRRFQSFIVYEVSSFLIPEGDGLVPKYGIFEAVRDEAKTLGL